jgi:hypothetical protein
VRTGGFHFRSGGSGPARALDDECGPLTCGDAPLAGPREWLKLGVAAGLAVKRAFDDLAGSIPATGDAGRSRSGRAYPVFRVHRSYFSRADLVVRQIDPGSFPPVTGPGAGAGPGRGSPAGQARKPGGPGPSPGRRPPACARARPAAPRGVRPAGDAAGGRPVPAWPAGDGAGWPPFGPSWPAGSGNGGPPPSPSCPRVSSGGGAGRNNFPGRPLGRSECLSRGYLAPITAVICDVRTP